MPTLIAFARLPRPGAVKTRLARSVGTAEAARIYGVLATAVHDSLLQARSDFGATIVRCLPEGDIADADAEGFLPGADVTWSQGEGDLGARVVRAMARAFAAGSSRVGIVGTDVVGLSSDLLARAFERLNDTDVVFAPTPDGGYGFIASRVPIPEAFESIEWSTPAVVEQTRARLRAAGRHWFEVPGLRDVDVASDLPGAIPLVSVLVPAWNEAPRLRENLPPLLEQVRLAQEPVELIVADGESADDTAQIARDLGANVVVAPRGRGTQLATAAQASTGQWLWVVHADARVEPGAVDAVVRFCQRATHPWGFCRVRVDLPSRSLRQMQFFNEGRARFWRMPYGDQGVVVRRIEWAHRGGFAPIPLMEDVALARRMARFGPPGTVGATLVADGRRWKRYGAWGTTLRNVITLGRFLFLRADPHRLAKTYRRGDEVG